MIGAQSQELLAPFSYNAPPPAPACLQQLIEPGRRFHSLI
jgi:hypothetical protein